MRVTGSGARRRPGIDTDPQAAALLDTVERQRASGARAVVARLAELGGLRATLDQPRAAAIAELVMDPEPFRRLVLRHGWTADEHTEHLQRVAAASLLR